MNRIARNSVTLMLLCFSGCAIHTPFHVVRYWADYNTERQCNAQVEFFDHLPPKSARVKLMRWGYNVGPNSQYATGTMGIGTGVWADRLMPWNRPKSDVEFYDATVPPTPPLPVLSPTPIAPVPEEIRPEAIPALPPPAPPAEADTNFPDPFRGNLSTSTRSQRVTTIGYQTDSERPAPRAASAAWIFTPPQRPIRVARP